MVEAKAFLDDQLPRKYRALLPQALRNAYAAVEAFAKDEAILQVESARINRGHVRAWAADAAIERLLKSGQWPFDYRWASYQRPTGKWLRIHLGASTLSVSQVTHEKSIPREAVFRTNNVVNNMPFLALDDSFKEEERVRGLPHLILVHGYQELDFIRIGMPNPRAADFGYIYQTPNLLFEPQVVDDGLPPAEAPDAQAEVELLKEELRKWHRDNEAN